MAMRDRLVLFCLTAVVLFSAACSSSGGSGPVDCTGGYASNGGCVLASQITGRQVAAQVEGYSLPPKNSRRLTKVHCAVAADHRAATCRGWLPARHHARSGHWLTVRLHINSEGGVRPVCQPRPSVFCAD
jgi:hypothetical protein